MKYEPIEARLQRHQLAERRANRRDFDTRYGNDRRHPYGVVRPDIAKQRAKRQKRQDLGTDLIWIVLGLTVGAVVLINI